MVWDIRGGLRVDAAHSTGRVSTRSALRAVHGQRRHRGRRLGYWTRSRLDLTRDAVWEDDIRELFDDDGRIRSWP
jgi:hypothetical protein